MKKSAKKADGKPIWKDTSRPIDERARDLVSRMTLEEKVSQLVDDAPEVKRLGVPEYHWWNECLHGVARAGRATVFPQAIGLAATWDAALVRRVASAIGDEARAKYNVAVRAGKRAQYWGLTFWTPNINIFRDPRWGRGQETYGEDPYLTGTLGAAFVRGLQGNGKVMKAAACAKHYAVHSGPEKDRHNFNAVVSPKDLWETYLPAFKMLVDAGVEAVMGAYNRTLGEPCCASKFLLVDILRGKWGFNGHVVSDCGAIDDIHEHHKFTKTPEESVALAISRGCDLNCGLTYSHGVAAVRQGLLSEADLDKALFHVLRTRFRLGLFDPPARDPFRRLSLKVVDSPAHRKLAREAATKSIVLLKNNGVLPLSKKIRQVNVLGPGAKSAEFLWGNYHGLSSRFVTILDAVVDKVGLTTTVDYREGFLLDRTNDDGPFWGTRDTRKADAVVAVLGITPHFENEEGDAVLSDNFGDRLDIGLPKNQVEFLRQLSAETKKSGRPLVVVLSGGSALAIPEVHELADAVLFMWYPGEEGGNAVADILFGDAVPSGRLPVTFPQSVDDLPPFEDYRMEGRTYKYAAKEPLYPFGFGLSYTRFEYSALKLSKKAVKSGEPLRAEVTARNAGKVAAEEVVQLYIADVAASVRVPRCELKRFQRVRVAAGKSKKVAFEITPEMMALVDDAGERRIEPGEFRVTIGGSSPGTRSIALGAAKPATTTFRVA